MTGLQVPLLLALLAAEQAPRAGGPRAAVAPDPRRALVELALSGDLAATLSAAEAFAARDPVLAAAMGVDYLRGDLLERLDRPADAMAAFALVLERSPPLHAHGRFRLARLQTASGHPEVAAGLLTNLLLHQPPPALLSPALELLRHTLAAGGDCRLLRSLVAARPGVTGPALPPLPSSSARSLVLTRAECARREERSAEARNHLAGLLAVSTEDDAARAAAEILATDLVARADRRLAGLVGRAFHDHREFERAAPLLREALRDPGLTPAAREQLLYALARSLFWEGDWTVAAGLFGELAVSTASAEERGRAFYQQGRALELAGDTLAASHAFSRASSVGTASTWAPTAVLARLRLAALSGDRATALAELVRLQAVPAWREQSGHGAMFLGVSAVVGGESTGVESLLAAAARGGRPGAEVAYWRGRLAEAVREPRSAVRSYLRALAADRYHPHALEALARLRSPELEPYAAAIGVELSRSPEPSDLHAAWLLLADEPRGVAARRALARHFASDGALAAYLVLAPVAPASWPLWRAPLARPEERLLALGVWDEGLAVVLQHFPVSQPALALTGSAILAANGSNSRSLYIAETLARRVPRRLPPELLAPSLRTLLYPRAYDEPLRREAAAAGVDPNLVAAIAREESRFDPRATSPANARGLMQLVLPTARRLGQRLGMPRIEPADLYRPEISLRLGSTYLAELAGPGGGVTMAQQVAAYNAGEAQAALWQRYCLGTEQAEYLSKVSFKETRDYLARVFASRAQYAELYGAAP